MASFRLALVILTLVLATDLAQASACTDPARKLFADHALKYKDNASGLYFSFYLGRFGDFERHFPCQVDHGTIHFISKPYTAMADKTSDAGLAGHAYYSDRNG